MMEKQEKDELLQHLNELITFRNQCEEDALAEVDGYYVNDPYDCDYYVRAAVVEYKNFLRKKGVICD